MSLSTIDSLACTKDSTTSAHRDQVFIIGANAIQTHEFHYHCPIQWLHHDWRGNTTFSWYLPVITRPIYMHNIYIWQWDMKCSNAKSICEYIWSILNNNICTVCRPHTFTLIALAELHAKTLYKYISVSCEPYAVCNAVAIPITRMHSIRCCQRCIAISAAFQCNRHQIENVEIDLF